MSHSVFALDISDGAETISGADVSQTFFQVLGTPLLVGHGFSGAPNELVLSERLWRSKLGGDKDVIGRVVQLSQLPYTVVGVAPDAFDMPLNTEVDNSGRFGPQVWVSLDPAVSRTRALYQFIGRRQPGATDSLVQSALTRALAPALPQGRAQDSVVARVESLTEHVRGRVSTAVPSIVAAAACVLLVACVSVSALCLSRNSARARETSVRWALGASRAQMIRPLLFETAALALVGAVLGLAVSAMLMRITSAVAAITLPAGFSRSSGPLMASLAVALSLVGLLLAMMPSIVQAFRNGNEALVRGERSISASNRLTHRMQGTLVVAQIAIAVPMVYGASALTRSFVSVAQEDYGIAPASVVTTELNVSIGRALPAEQVRQLARAVVANIGALPGVRSVVLANGLPPNRVRGVIELPSSARDTAQSLQMVFVNASPDYFRVLSIPLLRGRYVDETDGSDSPRVAVVSAAAARALFGDEDVVGRPLPSSNATRPGAMVVGVVGDVSYRGLEQTPRETIYYPFEQFPTRNISLVIASNGQGAGKEIVDAVHRVDPAISASPILPLADVIRSSVTTPRLGAIAGVAAAFMALSLASVGLYGFVAYSVRSRRHELAVRFALGASSRQTVALLLGRYLPAIGVGLAFGCGGALLVGKVIESLLFGVHVIDVENLLLASAALCVTIAAALFMPLLKATKIDPVELF
jgi:predicted permease